MRDWHGYWNEAPQLREADPLKQVGKTVGGVSVSAGIVQRIAYTIVERLAIGPADRVLDLCCGNGVITVEIAGHAAEVAAVDFSRPLIDEARRRFARPNIAYHCANVLTLSGCILDRPFDRIVMQEALQHFTAEQVGTLLARLAASSSAAAPVFFGSIPDAERLDAFYNTAERRAQYLRNLEAGTEPIGTWWHRGDLERLAARHGYRARLFDQHADLHTAHYRFDLLCEPR